MNKAFKANKKWKSARYFRTDRARGIVSAMLYVGCMETSSPMFQAIDEEYLPTGESLRLYKLGKRLRVDSELLEEFRVTNKIPEGCLL